MLKQVYRIAGNFGEGFNLANWRISGKRQIKAHQYAVTRMIGNSPNLKFAKSLQRQIHQI